MPGPGNLVPKNTGKKGKELERRAERELQEVYGAITDRARADVRWIGPGRVFAKRVDILGAFDILAVWPDHIAFIQVCKDSGGHAAKRRRAIEALGPQMPNLPGVSLQLWRYRGGQESKRDRLPRGFIREACTGAGTWDTTIAEEILRNQCLKWGKPKAT